MAFKSKADASFQTKLEMLLVRPMVRCTRTIKTGETIESRLSFRPAPLDTAAVEALFNQYGSYLELIDVSRPMESAEVLDHARVALGHEQGVAIPADV